MRWHFTTLVKTVGLSYLFGFGSNMSGFGFCFFGARFDNGRILSDLVNLCLMPGVIFVIFQFWMQPISNLNPINFAEITF